MAAGASADAIIVSGHAVFNEDWLPAGGKPTSKVVCVTNQNNAARTVMLEGITLDQLIYHFRREYPTARQ